MRGQWIVFLLLLVLMVFAGIYTANLMWGQPKQFASASETEFMETMEETGKAEHPRWLSRLF